MKTSLSVLVPVFNEQHLVRESLQRLRILERSEHLERVEVIVVDDCSTDDSRRIIEGFLAELPAAQGGGAECSWIFLKHDRNRGKGQAIQDGSRAGHLRHHRHPRRRPRVPPAATCCAIVTVFVEEEADAVFGSRFAGGERRRVLLYRHQLGNKLLTFLCNLVTNLNLTDMETCYKAVRTDLLKSIPLAVERLPPRAGADDQAGQAAGARSSRCPISYSGRTYQEGKKINWRTASGRCGRSLRFALSDYIYQQGRVRQPHPRALWRGRRSSTPGWPTRSAATADSASSRSAAASATSRCSWCPARSTSSSTSTRSICRRSRRCATERPYLRDELLRRHRPRRRFRRLGPGYDTVVCLNVIEHVEGDRDALANIRSVLSEGGRAIILVPQGPWNFGTLDKVLGHFRRYSRQSLRAGRDRRRLRGRSDLSSSTGSARSPGS